MYFSGTNVYNNNKGKTVLIESWTSTITNITNPSNNFKSYIDVSYIQIQNLSKLNGTYITNYVFDDNFINKSQKELVVYYIGVTNKCRLKITYIDFFNKVKICRI